jgi:Glucanosyltransferase
VQPRTFQEVGAIYSSQMTGVFSGGLAYEFTEEPNNYGLVQINGTTATILNDYIVLQTQYEGVKTVEVGTSPAITRATTCPPANSYANLNGTTDLPDTPAADLIKNGLSSSLYSAGKLISPSQWSTTYDIVDQNGNAITNKAVNSNGYTPSNPANNGGGQSGSQVGGGVSNSTTTKSMAGKIECHGILFVTFAMGFVAWNILA